MKARYQARQGAVPVNVIWVSSNEDRGNRKPHRCGVSQARVQSPSPYWTRSLC
jgi:hypothetical protein